MRIAEDPPPDCYVCRDTGLDNGTPCARCRPLELEDHKAARREAERARRILASPKRHSAVVQEYSNATGNARIVLLVLASLCDPRGWVSLPMPRLCLLCRMSDSTVRRSILKLRAGGDLRLERDGKGPSNYPAWSITTLSPRVTGFEVVQPFHPSL